MNTIRLFTIAAVAFTLAATSSFAEDQHATCCLKAKEAGKECAHPCCVEAVKNKTVCEKCGGKKEEKKKPS